MARLLQLAATKKPLIISAVTLSVLASVTSFVPYISIYMIIREILATLPELAALDSSHLIRLGWLAFGGVVGNILLYFGALVCSHLAAFGTLYKLKVDFASHLARVPLGFHVLVGSGKLRKIMDENIEKIEEFIARQLPDIAASIVAPIVMLTILFAVDWQFGFAAFVGIAISFVIQISVYGKESAKIWMSKYQKSIEEMNNAAVEYVRGISVVKAFRQTVYSFRSLHDTIKAYTSMVIPYTLSWKNSFSAYVTLINNIYLFVVPAGILIGINATDCPAFAAKFLFFLLFTPAIASILLKVMYANGNSMRIINGVEAMDALLAEPEHVQPEFPKTINSYDVTFDKVAFSYDKEKKTTALSNLPSRRRKETLPL